MDPFQGKIRLFSRQNPADRQRLPRGELIAGKKRPPRFAKRPTKCTESGSTTNRGAAIKGELSNSEKSGPPSWV
ncbi:MAG: hypothetical protein WCS43_02805, partial [Verrucomicrobiota bacterium]